jgi:hypothetical protein
MELAAALVMLGTKHVVKALVHTSDSASESGVDSAAADVVDRLLGAMLETQDETAETLRSLETKLDALSLAAYRDAMTSGYNHLEDAMPRFREAGQRRECLNAARSRFIDAAASAQRPNAPVDAALHAEVLAATCWLAQGSLQDFQRVLSKSADRAMRTIVELNSEVHFPSLGDVYELWISRQQGLARSMAKARLADPSGVGDLAEEIYRRAAGPRDTLTESVNQVQRLRQQFGAEPRDCPCIIGFQRDGKMSRPGDKQYFSWGPFPTVDVVPDIVLRQPARYGGVAMRVETAAVRLYDGDRGMFARRAFLLDATVEIEASCPVEMDGRRNVSVDQLLAWNRLTAEVPMLPTQEGLPVWNGERRAGFATSTRVALRAWAWENRERGNEGMFGIRYVPERLPGSIEGRPTAVCIADKTAPASQPAKSSALGA